MPFFTRPKETFAPLWRSGSPDLALTQANRARLVPPASAQPQDEECGCEDPVRHRGDAGVEDAAETARARELDGRSP